mmetsp:Transcript_8138/g.19656  ORF Transcript_8138/g.19656 Transcript_8138/m.19656 type:complete len:105 (+) Transcript_8138:711-1025(+)
MIVNSLQYGLLPGEFIKQFWSNTMSFLKYTSYSSRPFACRINPSSNHRILSFSASTPSESLLSSTQLRVCASVQNIPLNLSHWPQYQIRKSYEMSFSVEIYQND